MYSRNAAEMEKCMKTIAFVCPWFGENIPGGAEMELRGLTTHLNESGLKLEILTTCVEKFASDWNVNFYKAGCDTVCGLKVRRFPVRKRDVKRFDAVNYKFMNNIPVSEAEEKIYMQEMVNSTALYDYIRNNKDNYALFVYIPYMFGTTYEGVGVCPHKSVLIPCLHDESYAYMKLFAKRYSQAAGMIFHSKPEYELAKKLYGSNYNGVVLGEGVDTGLNYDAEGFRKKFGITEPFILYAGRKEEGKNVHTLLKYFAHYKKENHNNLKLVLVGGGQIAIPESVKGDVIDLGFVSLQDKTNAESAALLLCNPSKFESFSLVIMESWLCRRPVIVYGGCGVTRNFVSESNGGLYFNGYYEFEGAVNYIMKHPDIADVMGNNGYAYVNKEFAWDVIVRKYTEYFKELAAKVN